LVHEEGRRSRHGHVQHGDKRSGDELLDHAPIQAETGQQRWGGPDAGDGERWRPCRLRDVLQAREGEVRFIVRARRVDIFCALLGIGLLRRSPGGSAMTAPAALWLAVWMSNALGRSVGLAGLLPILLAVVLIVAVRRR
jgi:hypothetical protein